jgi:hypothetical protein
LTNSVTTSAELATLHAGSNVVAGAGLLAATNGAIVTLSTNGAAAGGGGTQYTKETISAILTGFTLNANQLYYFPVGGGGNSSSMFDIMRLWNAPADGYFTNLQSTLYNNNNTNIGTNYIFRIYTNSPATIALSVTNTAGAVYTFTYVTNKTDAFTIKAGTSVCFGVVGTNSVASANWQVGVQVQYVHQ